MSESPVVAALRLILREADVEGSWQFVRATANQGIVAASRAAASGAQAVPPLDSLSEALHEAGIGCSSEVCEPTTEFHQGIRRTMHDTDARALLAALHPENGPQSEQKHAAWCYLPKDHQGMCEGDQ